MLSTEREEGREVEGATDGAGGAELSAPRHAAWA